METTLLEILTDRRLMHPLNVNKNIFFNAFRNNH